MANTFTYILFASCMYYGIAQQDDRPPPKYSLHKLPQTRFTCEGKFAGRYYADPDTDCQMFHVCPKTSRRDLRDYKFLCPNGTVFDQDHQVCANYNQVVCHFDTDTNPLGPFFEIFKLSTKESEHQREFGSAPIRDPEYLGQNTLSNEEFQVEEYNNNKLASSRNSLSFKNSQLNRKDDIAFSKTSTPESIRLITKEVINTTPFYVTRKPTITSLENESVASKSSTPAPLFYTSSTNQPNFSRRLVFITSPPADEFNDLSDPNGQQLKNEHFVTPIVTTTSAPTTTHRINQNSEKTPHEKSTSIFDNPQFRFNDFRSLSKFQTQFHRSFKDPPTTDVTTTTTETFSTISPTNDYTTPFQNYESTPLPVRRHHFERFTGFRQRQADDERKLTTESVPQSTINLDFNVRPQSETNPPTELGTTRRLPIFQNSYRTTYQDVTTSGPPSFKQQPVRFSDEFFKKIDVNKVDFLKSDDEDDYYANAVLPTETLPTTKPTEVTVTTTPEPITFPPTGGRLLRRRRPSKSPVQRNRQNGQEYPRRFQNSQKLLAVTEPKRRNEEVFNAEASINSGSAGINGLQTTLLTSTSTTPIPREYTSRHEQTPQDGRDVAKSIVKLRGKKRFRDRTTTISTAERNSSSYVTVTTYRPRGKFRLRKLTAAPTTPLTTTTVSIDEPELVTASTDEVERLRSRKKFLRSNYTSSENIGNPPTRLLLKLNAKSSFKAVHPSPPSKPTTNSEEGSTRSPDYDYMYFDTDPGRQVADSVSKLDTFGKKYA